MAYNIFVVLAAINGLFYLASKLRHEHQRYSPLRSVTPPPLRVQLALRKGPRKCSEVKLTQYALIFGPNRQHVQGSGYRVASLGGRHHHELAKPSGAADSVRPLMGACLILGSRTRSSYFDHVVHAIEQKSLKESLSAVLVSSVGREGSPGERSLLVVVEGC